MAGGADSKMGAEDVGPVLNRMAVRAGLVVKLAKISGRIKSNGVVDSASC